MRDAAVPSLAGAKVLVLEDDYYLAIDLQEALEKAGATVIGPCPDVPDALSLIGEERPDCALLDVNLGRGPSFDLPRELARQGVPFAFITGYDREVIPEEFNGADRLEKPVTCEKVTAVAGRMLAERP